MIAKNEMIIAYLLADEETQKEIESLLKADEETQKETLRKIEERNRPKK